MSGKIAIAAAIVGAWLVLGKPGLGGFMALEAPSDAPGSSPSFTDAKDAQRPAPSMTPIGFGVSGLPAINPQVTNPTYSVRQRNANNGSTQTKNTNASFDVRGVPRATLDFWEKFDPEQASMCQYNSLAPAKMFEAAKAKKEYLALRGDNTHIVNV